MNFTTSELYALRAATIRELDLVEGQGAPELEDDLGAVIGRITAEIEARRARAHQAVTITSTPERAVGTDPLGDWFVSRSIARTDHLGAQRQHFDRAVDLVRIANPRNAYPAAWDEGYRDGDRLSRNAEDTQTVQRAHAFASDLLASRGTLEAERIAYWAGYAVGTAF